jgi:ABC-type sugar transport system ATPase subunit
MVGLVMTLRASGNSSSIAGAQVELANIRMQFGSVRAVSDVSLTARTGTVHSLVGENGAGKSTLGKIIAGVYRPDRGQVLLDGQPVELSSPVDALRRGIALVSQELALMPHRTVLENVFLGDEPRRAGLWSGRDARRRFAEAIAETGFDLEPDAVAGTLRKSEQQKVEILRAVSRGARLIVMDEPTSALGEGDSAVLLDIIRQLAQEGRTVIFVSHFLNDILSVSDDITILRDGVLVRSGPASKETPQSLVDAMAGRSVTLELPERHSRPAAAAPVVLRVSNLNSRSGVRDASLEIRRGEILGVAGLVGSGRSELARAIFGADRHDGVIELDGERVTIASPTQAVDQGVVMLPESRKELGLVLGRSIVENVALPYLNEVSTWGWISRRREAARAHEVLEQFSVRRSSDDVEIGTLSGGNQQKAMFAKWFFRQPRVLIADEPTQGVDVAAKTAIYRHIIDLARDGLAVLLISSELEEVLALAHRTIVMREGKVVAEFMNDRGDAVDVLSAALGASTEAIAPRPIV